MKIKATLVKAKELKSGELFSTASQAHWDNIDPLSIGEKVYIRTDAPTPKEEEEEDICRIEITN